MTTLPFHNIVSMQGFTPNDFIHTVNLGLAADGTAMAMSDVGCAMTQDISGPNKFRMATDGDAVFGVLKVWEGRSTGPVGAIAFKCTESLWIEANDPAAIGDTVVGSAGGTEASDTFTQTGTNNFGNGDTYAIGGKTYTFQTTLTNVANNVALGATFALSAANLVAAITGGAGSGTAYAAATTANANGTAAYAAGVITNSAILGGAAGNAITSVYTAAGTAAGVMGQATLSGGNSVVTNRGGWVKKASSNVAGKNYVVERGLDPAGSGLTYVVVVIGL
jgi:hypothetical protein